MKDTHRENMENLFYQISLDIYNLLKEDSEDIVDAIAALSRKVEKLSDDIAYGDKIIYKRSGESDLKFSLD